MNMAKSIPTYFNGVKFRSRLEARWAVFLESLAIPFIFEHQGFVSGDVCYLPDFYLPDQDIFLEIKPTAPNIHDFEKICVAVDATQMSVVLGWGLPSLEFRFNTYVRDGEEIDFREEAVFQDLDFSKISIPSGMIGVDVAAKNAILSGDFLPIRAQTEPGLFQSCNFAACPQCYKFSIVSEPTWLEVLGMGCGCGCPEETRAKGGPNIQQASKKVRESAVDNAINFRFGKIA